MMYLTIYVTDPIQPVAGGVPITGSGMIPTNTGIPLSSMHRPPLERNMPGGMVGPHMDGSIHNLPTHLNMNNSKIDMHI